MPSSYDDDGIMHLHRATPDDGTAPPSCDADGIVPLRPSNSEAPSNAAPPRNVAHSDAAPPRSVAPSDAAPPHNVGPSDAAPPRNVAPYDAAPPRNIAPCDAAPPCDIAKLRRSMEQGEEDMETRDVGRKVGSRR